jgi:hypothetical protein
MPLWRKNTTLCQAEDHGTHVTKFMHVAKRARKISCRSMSWRHEPQVQAGSETMDYQPIALPPSHFFDIFWDSGYVSAKGTWAILNEKIAWPEQTAEIQGSKDAGTCMEATAIGSRSGGSPQPSVDIEIYEIECWDQPEIVAKPRPSEAGCTRYANSNHTTLGHSRGKL